MAQFNSDLTKLYQNYGLDVMSNTGRRNALLSAVQEEFFAQELRTKYPNAKCDGKTGYPDILIPEINVELECKLTSPTESGAISLQADHESLNHSKDFLYVIANRDFTAFAVFLFQGLTQEDFSANIASSRGKVKMKKSSAFSKAHVLHGSFASRKEKFLAEISHKLSADRIPPGRLRDLKKRLEYWQNADDSISVSFDPV
jgi:hypothetical protein